MNIEMSSEEVKLQRSQNRKRNYLAKVLHDPGEHRGAFRIKVHDERKGEYKRIRMRVNKEYDDEENY